VDLRRLRASDWLAALSGAALVGLLWAPWYRSFVAPAGAHVAIGKGGWTAYAAIPAISVHSFNGWQAMAVNDFIFLLAGLLGIWLAVATASSSTQAVPIAASVFATLIGLLASVLAVVRLIWPPDLGPGPTARQGGVYLAMDAAVVLTFAALVSMRDERRGEGIHVPITPLPAPEGHGA
jgi:hypothetical protein